MEGSVVRDESTTPRLCIARIVAPLISSPGDLIAEEGEIIVVQRQLGKDWFYGHISGHPDRIGLVPASAIEVIQGSAVLPSAQIVDNAAHLQPQADAQHEEADEEREPGEDGAEDEGDDTYSDPYSDDETPGEGRGEDTAAWSGDAQARQPPPPPPRPMSKRRASRRSAAGGGERHSGEKRGEERAELISAISIPFCERKLTLDSELHSWYTIDIATSGRMARVEKRFSELRTADAQLRNAFPSCFTHSSQASCVTQLGAKTPIDVSLQDAALMQGKRTAATMEMRRLTADRYLKLAASHPTINTVILRFLLGTPSPSAGVTGEGSGARSRPDFNRGISNNRLSLSLSAVRDASLPPLGTAFNVSGLRETALLPLPSQQTFGEIPSFPHGAQQKSNGQQDAAGPSPNHNDGGEMQTGEETGISDESPSVDVVEPAIDESSLPVVQPMALQRVIEDANSSGAAIEFNMESLEAFDALMEQGFAVMSYTQTAGDDGEAGHHLTDDDSTVIGTPPPVPDGADEEFGFNSLDDEDATELSTSYPYPRMGQRVVLSYEALVWDGSTTTAHRYERVDRAGFHIGDFRDDSVPRGLHNALQRVPVGTSVAIVLGPDAAYGQPGKPPHVPAAAHLVYFLRVFRVSGASRPMGLYSGPRPSSQKARLGAVFPAGKKPLLDDQMMQMAASLLGSMPGGPSSSFGKFQGRGGRTVQLSPPDEGMAPSSSSPPTVTATGHAGGYRTVVGSGEKMPSAEEAEKAFRAYLASMGQDADGNHAAKPPRAGSAIGGFSFVRGLFGRSSMAEAATDVSAPSTSPAPTHPTPPHPPIHTRSHSVFAPAQSEGGEGGNQQSTTIFSRLFKRSSTNPTAPPDVSGVVASNPPSRSVSPAAVPAASFVVGAAPSGTWNAGAPVSQTRAVTGIALTRTPSNQSE